VRQEERRFTAETAENAEEAVGFRGVPTTGRTFERPNNRTLLLESAWIGSFSLISAYALRCAEAGHRWIFNLFLGRGAGLD
jgi:hypothetical protein